MRCTVSLVTRICRSRNENVEVGVASHTIIANEPLRKCLPPILTTPLIWLQPGPAFQINKQISKMKQVDMNCPEFGLALTYCLWAPNSPICSVKKHKPIRALYIFSSFGSWHGSLASRGHKETLQERVWLPGSSVLTATAQAACPAPGASRASLTTPGSLLAVTSDLSYELLF